MTDFDAIVVGAGPAGAAAALRLAKAGRSVLLVERGPFPGAKNMYGGVIYGRILDEVVPRWWEQVPVQRWITRRATMITTAEQALSIDYRTQAWGREPYNGFTAYRAEFDSWLAGHAERAGAVLLCSATVTDLIRDANGRVVGVQTDRPDGEVRAKVVIACDGVHSFLARSAGLYDNFSAEHITVGVKEVLGLPRQVIEERCGLTGDEGLDIEILGCTKGVPGGGFLYTNRDTISVGVVLSVTGLAKAGVRPEELIARLKAHPSIAPILAGAQLKEYTAHTIPEGGYDAMPKLAADGLLVAGDAAGFCLAAGIWLEGVNYAIGSGLVAGEVAAGALAAGDTGQAMARAYDKALRDTFVLADHAKLRRAPHLVLSDRVQTQYPAFICDLVEQVFTVTNPQPKAGMRRWFGAQRRRHDVKLRHLAADALTGLRSFG